MRFLMLLCLVLGCTTQKSRPSLSNSVKIDVHKQQLANGMTSLIIQDNKLPIFSLYLFYKVGGKNEKLGITGASHFLEHMMFKGAKKFGKNTLDFIIEGSGGNTNAYTTNDQTVYYENLPANQLKTILEIEADRLENLSLDKEDFEKERLVVLEERKMRYENSPKGQLYQSMIQELYKGTPYEIPVIGWIPDLKKVSREEIHAYFKKFYAPNNLVLVLAGDVETTAAQKMIKDLFEKIPASPSVAEAHAALKDEDFTPKLVQSRELHVKGESPNPLFMMAYPSVKLGHADGFPLDIFSSILSLGQSSPLTRQYILRPDPMATSLYAAHQQLEKSGYFLLGGDLVNGIKIPQFKKDLQEKLSFFCENEVTAENIQKVKNNYLLSFFSSLDSNAGMATFVGDREQLLGDWKFYQKELELYEAVSVEDVKKSCREILKKPSVFVTVWNKNK